MLAGVEKRSPAILLGFTLSATYPRAKALRRCRVFPERPWLERTQPCLPGSQLNSGRAEANAIVTLHGVEPVTASAPNKTRTAVPGTAAHNTLGTGVS